MLSKGGCYGESSPRKHILRYIGMLKELEVVFLGQSWEGSKKSRITEEEVELQNGGNKEKPNSPP